MATRTGFADSPLIRLLGRLREAEGTTRAAAVPAAPLPFVERLSHWLGWTDAISLSAVLNAPATEASRTAARTGQVAADADTRECVALRQALARSIRDDNVLSAAPGRAPRQLLPGETPAPPATDFAPYRQRYLTRQQAMEAGVDALCARLRGRLAARSPQAARLAAVEAVLSQVLDARERTLLATVPATLEAHFKRLRSAAAEAVAEAESRAEPAPPATAWLDGFCQDMQALLLAELDFRFQPVDALLEALRQPAPGITLTHA